MKPGIPDDTGADNNSAPFSWKTVQQRGAALGQYDRGVLDSAVVEPMCAAQLGEDNTYCDLPVGHSGDHSALIEVRAHWPHG